MPKDKRSFFERLTGSVSTNENYEEEQDTEEAYEEPRAHLAVAGATKTRPHTKAAPARKEEDWLASDEEGQLTVDVFQTDNDIIVQSTVAGVRPDDLDVQITRDMITVRGKREQTREVSHDNYFYQELYWGSFSRSILFPCEVDVDGAEASLKHGLLTVKIPKLDRNRSERIKVKNE
jgi:HSP20 family protein